MNHSTESASGSSRLQLPLLGGLLVAASLLVDFAVAKCWQDHPASPLAIHLALGLCLGQVGLLAAAAVASRSRIWIWLLATAGTSSVWAGFFAASFGRSFAAWDGMLLSYALAIAAGMLVVRGLLFMQRHRAKNNSRRNEVRMQTTVAGIGVGSARRWQFTLKGLMSLTAGVAVLLAVMGRLEPGPLSSPAVLARCFWVPETAVLSLVLAFTTSRRWRSLVAANLLVTAAIVIWLTARSLPLEAIYEERILFMAVIQAAYLASAGLVLRTAGYRPVWACPTAEGLTSLPATA